MQSLRKTYKVDGTIDLINNQSILNAMENSSLHGLKFEQLNVNNKLGRVYSVRINDAHRVILTFCTIGEKNYLILLEYSISHYKDSRYIKDGVLDNFLLENMKAFERLVKENNIDFNTNQTNNNHTKSVNHSRQEALIHQTKLVTLSNNQSDILNSDAKFQIIIGGPGSGKSLLGLLKIEKELEINHGIKNETLYFIAESPHVVKEMQRIWNEKDHYNPYNKTLHFKTYADLYKDITNSNYEIVDKDFFVKWFTTIYYNKETMSHTKKNELIELQRYANDNYNNDLITLMYQEFRIISGYTLDDYCNVNNNFIRSLFRNIRNPLSIAYTSYLEHLKSKNKIDLSLCECKEFKNIGNDHITLIVVDESQDFSLIQLKQLYQLHNRNSSLIQLKQPHQLHDQNSKIVFLHDHNQTMQDLRSKYPYIISLAHSRGEKETNLARLEVSRLDISYRCPKAVTELAQQVLNLKLHLTGGISDKDQQTTITSHLPLKDSDNAVQWYNQSLDDFIEDTKQDNDLKINQNSVKGRLLALMENSTNSAVITLKKDLTAIKQKLKGNPNVFTAEDVKGLEKYNLVIIVNPFEDEIFKQANKKFLSIDENSLAPNNLPKPDRDDFQYAPPFNALYTALCRTTGQLVIIQKGDHSIKYLIDFLKDKLTSNKSSEVGINQLPKINEDWEQEALDAWINGNIDHTSEIFNNRLKVKYNINSHDADTLINLFTDNKKLLFLLASLNLLEGKLNFPSNWKNTNDTIKMNKLADTLCYSVTPDSQTAESFTLYWLLKSKKSIPLFLKLCENMMFINQLTDKMFLSILLKKDRDKKSILSILLNNNQISIFSTLCKNQNMLNALVNNNETIKALLEFESNDSSSSKMSGLPIDIFIIIIKAMSIKNANHALNNDDLSSSIILYVKRHLEAIKKYLTDLYNSPKKSNNDTITIDKVTSLLSKLKFNNLINIKKPVDNYNSNSVTKNEINISRGSINNNKNNISNHYDDNILFTQLITAVEKGDTETIKNLMNHNKRLLGMETNNGSTALHIAVEKGHFNIVKYLINNNNNNLINQQNKNGYTPFYIAVEKGHFNIVKELNKAKAAHNMKTSGGGWTLLHFAASKGHHEITNYLTDTYQDLVNEVNNLGGTPLHVAVEYGHLEIVELLINKNVDHKIKLHDGRTILHLAVERGYLEIVKYLLKNCVDLLNETNHNKMTPLHIAVAKPHHQVTKYLIDTCQDLLNEKNDSGSTLLHTALEKGNIEIAIYLIKKDIKLLNVMNINKITPLQYAVLKGHLEIFKCLIEIERNILSQKDPKGWTLLHYAAATCHNELTKYLIDNCPNLLNETSEQGTTPLHNATLYGNLEIVKYLVSTNESLLSKVDNNKSTPLHLAVGGGHLEVVKFLIEKNKSLLNCQNSNGESLLHVAARCGNLNIVEYLKQQNANLNQLNNNKMAPLHHAIKYDHLDVVNYLLEQKATLSDTSKTTVTPLHIAAGYGKLNIIKFLIQQNANVNQVDNYNNTPLFYAIEQGHLDVVKYLLEQNATLNDTSTTSLTPLHVAAKFGKLNIVEYLIQEQKANLNHLDNNNKTPLYHAIEHGRLDVVNYLLKQNATLNDTSTTSLTPLHVAARFGKLNIVEYLIQEQKANLNQLDNNNNKTPLYHAIEHGRLDVVNYLLKQNATLNHTSNITVTPLHVAAAFGKLNIVEYLIQEQKANLNQVDNYNNTPLYYAIEFGRLDVVKYLLIQNATLNHTSNITVTPLHVAARFGKLNIVEYLIQKNANLNQVDNYKLTPLYYAIKFGHFDVAKYLLEQNATLNDTSTTTLTPLHVAAANGRLDIVQYLVGNGANLNAIHMELTPLGMASQNRHDNVKNYLESALLNKKEDNPKNETDTGQSPVSTFRSSLFGPNQPKNVPNETTIENSIITTNKSP